jgi:hypothetical protein
MPYKRFDFSKECLGVVSSGIMNYMKNYSKARLPFWITIFIRFARFFESPVQFYYLFNFTCFFVISDTLRRLGLEKAIFATI